jgi:hypothetical protein
MKMVNRYYPYDFVINNLITITKMTLGPLIILNKSAKPKHHPIILNKGWEGSFEKVSN